jgi:FAD/FMN-containing dehydrogenase
MSTATIPQLRELRGRVITPADAEYDAARRVFGGAIDRRPAVIARVADSKDVAAVISYARESGLELAVRSSGHSGAGHGVIDGGVVIDLRDLKALAIDAGQRTAWAETGLTAVEYTKAAEAHGLVTGFGDTGSVGISGLTLGGGIGYFARKHGLTIDDLIAADVVTADGQLLRVDAHSHPDLFWAIRGGGGNFGVATRFQLRLHPLDSFVGGMLMLPATVDIIHSFVAEAERAPEELTAIVNVMPAPPMPFVPAEHHGKLIVLAFVAYAGAVEASQRALAPFRALAKPIVDMVRPSLYSEIYPPEDPNYHPIATGRATFMDVIDRRAVETIVEHLEASTAPMRVAQVRVLGGAMARIPDDATAFAHRTRRMLVSFAAVYPRPEDESVHAPWVEKFMGAVRGEQRGAYVNFLNEDGAARIREAYPGRTWDRLAAIKARYDPTNLFRHNHNIPPKP